MADTISPEARAAIEAALAAGKVTRVPTGVTTSLPQYRYNPTKKVLEVTDPERFGGGVAAHRARSAAARAKRGVTPSVERRRAQIINLSQEGLSVAQIADRLGVSQATIYGDSAALGGLSFGKPSERDELPPQIAAPAKRAALPGKTRSSNRQQQVADAIAKGLTAKQTAELLGIGTVSAYQHATKAGLKFPREPKHGAAESVRGGSKDKATNAKIRRAAVKVDKVADRRRFKVVPVPMGDPGVIAPAGTTGTVFPTRVFDPVDSEHVLIDGSSNSKIGGDVLVGWLKGARVFTLTLEERATCPRSCAIWDGCYGNAMQYSRRWRHGPALIGAIERELAEICAAHKRVLIRLHVLGDFYSQDYVEFWGQQMARHPGLHVFGFTAHKDSSPIGAMVAALRKLRPGQWWVRHSNMTGAWGSFTVDFPTARKRIGDAIVCPEQRDGMAGSKRGVHCGSCGVCWSTDTPVAFVEH